jgi:hypothetical protein
MICSTGSQPLRHCGPILVPTPSEPGGTANRDTGGAVVTVGLVGITPQCVPDAVEGRPLGDEPHVHGHEDGAVAQDLS